MPYEHRQIAGTPQRTADDTSLMCTVCGCAVADTELHDAWHDSLKEAKPKEHDA